MRVGAWCLVVLTLVSGALGAWTAWSAERVRLEVVRSSIHRERDGERVLEVELLLTNEGARPLTYLAHRAGDLLVRQQVLDGEEWRDFPLFGGCGFSPPAEFELPARGSLVLAARHSPDQPLGPFHSGSPALAGCPVRFGVRVQAPRTFLEDGEPVWTRVWTDPIDTESHTVQ